GFPIMKDARYILLFLLSVSLLFFAADKSMVLAQNDSEPTIFKNVQLWINPEYDDPRLLVMIEGKITGANPPSQVSFLVPSSAFMYSAGSKDAQGKYTGGPPARTLSSIPGWDEISYTVTTDTFRVEYYDTTTIAGQPDKNISYDFRWLYPLSDLSVVIQQPRTATNFDVAPKGLAGIDRDGLVIQSYSYQNLSINDSPLHYDITYTKTDSNVSTENPQLNSSGSPDSTDVQLILVVLVSIVVLGGGALWVLKSVKTSKLPVKHAPDKETVTTSKKKRRSDRFCRNCGRLIQNSEIFCPRCGNKVS
ncbi:hypothetical protein ACFLX1_00805, partial [Chloroflexota bacterium]